MKIVRIILFICILCCWKVNNFNNIYQKRQFQDEKNVKTQANSRSPLFLVSGRECSCAPPPLVVLLSSSYFWVVVFCSSLRLSGAAFTLSFCGMVVPAPPVRCCIHLSLWSGASPLVGGAAFAPHPSARWRCFPRLLGLGTAALTSEPSFLQKELPNLCQLQ